MARNRGEGFQRVDASATGGLRVQSLSQSLSHGLSRFLSDSAERQQVLALFVAFAAFNAVSALLHRLLCERLCERPHHVALTALCGFNAT